jgi:galactose mutarotase-like enzyme
MYSALTVDQVRAVALRDGLVWVSWTFPGNHYVCAQPNSHLQDFLHTYNFTRRLKTLRGLTLL